ncbi:hypothetical protein [Streptomyces sp. RG80]|uniref:hypothetical protein n=1 Tax=Streptomyces sp. RG80 TaxID=3157340 RepID=UPI00338EAB94
MNGWLFTVTGLSQLVVIRPEESVQSVGVRQDGADISGVVRREGDHGPYVRVVEVRQRAVLVGYRWFVDGGFVGEQAVR